MGRQEETKDLRAKQGNTKNKHMRYIQRLTSNKRNTITIDITKSISRMKKILYIYRIHDLRSSL